MSAGSSRSSAAPRSTAPRFGVGGLVDRLVGLFGARTSCIELQRHLLRDEESDNQALRRSRVGVSRAGRRDQRRALRGAGRAAALRRPHVHPPQDDARARRAAAERGTPSATSRRRTRWRGCSPICREAVGGTRALAERLEYTMADLGYRFPDYPVPAGETMASFLRKMTQAGARERYRPYHDRARASGRARARSDREARSRRLLPDRLGHRQLLPPAGHPRPGPRLGGQQRRLLQPRHHRRRSGRHGSAVRALPLRGARRVARHRSRSAERRSPRAGDPARLREVRDDRRLRRRGTRNSGLDTAVRGSLRGRG